MTARSKTAIKAFFETGDVPTQTQFADLIDSYTDALVDVAALDGVDDEVQIQAAIDSLYTTVTNEAITGGAFVVLDNMDGTPASRWTALNGAVLANEGTIKFAGTHSLRVTPAGSGSSNFDPGVEDTFSAINTTNYNYVDFWVYPSPGVTKLRVRLFDGSNNERRYSCNVPNSGSWNHIRIPLGTPYFTSVTPPNMAAIVKMNISLMSGESGTLPPTSNVFYIDQVAFTQDADLANCLVRYASDVITNSTGTVTYVRGTDYDIDWDAGKLITITSGAITTGQSLLADYVWGGGYVKLPPRTYRISETGVNLRSHLVLDMQGALLIADGTFSDADQILDGAALYRTTVIGGTIDGQRDALAINVNIAGIRVVDAIHLRIRDTAFREINGAAVDIGVSSLTKCQHITLTDLQLNECGGEFVDHFGEVYEAPGGDESKSAFTVHDCEYVTISGVRNENAHGDAMWIKSCNHGVMTGCHVTNSRMGAIFFETCVNWSITANVVENAGSRGTTIEWDSAEIAFVGNTVRYSGRECVWLCGTTRVLVSGNVLFAGGRLRMNDGLGDLNTATVRVSSQTPYNALDNAILNNLIYSESDYQSAAIVVDTDGGTNSNTAIRGNYLRGTQTTITNSGTNTTISNGNQTTSSGTTGGSGSGGAGNQYVELNVNGTVYKVLHDGTV